MAGIIETLAWSMLALLHLRPAAALLQPSLLTRLYGVAPGDGAFMLLRHRAAFFGMVVIVCGWAAVDPGVRAVAAVIVTISMGSFLLLYRAHGSPAMLRSIAVADLLGLPALGYVIWRAFSAG